MIRPPSLQKPREDFYSRDPAFVQLPELAEDASAEVAKEAAKAQLEHDRQWEVARETGDFAALRVEGCEPTTFVMRPIVGDVFRKLIDKVSSGELREFQAAQYAFRIAVVSVAGFASVKPNWKHPELGLMAPPDLANELDAIDHRIVTELGTVAMRRAGAISPKP